MPAGVADGQTIKLNGQGGPGMNGGPAGDLYITFVIGDDPVYKREGDNLYMNVPIDLYTAVLGGEQIIETLNGKVKMKIKPETQNGTKVRLRGKGFPVYKQDGQFGDLFVTYEVKIPTHLTEKQKELFRPDFYYFARRRRVDRNTHRRRRTVSSRLPAPGTGKI